MLDPYSSLKKYDQFIIWKLITREGKSIKLPCDPTGNVADAHSQDNHMDYGTATTLAEVFGVQYGIGFVFTSNDPFWVVDIDGAYTDAGWSTLSTELLAMLPNALVEVSQSGRGLHIIGSGTIPPHAKKNTALHIECYHEMRFLALGRQDSAYGDAGSDLSAYLPALVDKYFPPRVGADEPSEWTTQPVAEWNGYATDEELITKMLGVVSVGAVFGEALSPAQLWVGDIEALSKAFPSESGDDYDRSSADASLAQRLAFYTGKNCERMERIMMMSGLVRDKWENRPDYLQNTILRACSLQSEVFAFPIIDMSVVEKFEPTALKGKSEAQVNFAEQVRAEMMVNCTDMIMGKLLCSVDDPSFWLENRGSDLTVLAQRLVPAPTMDAIVPAGVTQRLEGYQYFDFDRQAELFEGCVYLTDQHAVFCPNDDNPIQKPEAFNVTFGNREFQMAWDKREMKPTKKAFEAFTQSRILVCAKAAGITFKPRHPYGAIVDGKLNMYKPVDVLRIKGDISRFTNHLKKLFPNENDRNIILGYLAGCVQYQGVKFQWAPLIQGTQGNGKSIISLAVAEAIGWKYVHSVDAADLSNKFNAWLSGNVLYIVEDIYVADHRNEVLEALKPMITSTRGMSIQRKGQDQHTEDICGNFIFNSNHKNAIKKTNDDRRYAIFYTPQQTVDDIARDGMGKAYFDDLLPWLKGTDQWAHMGENYGYGVVSEFLHTYPIPDEFNPVKHARAPHTSSTAEAVHSGLGGIEQEIMEAIECEQVGFAGGWVSSFALDELLARFRAEKMIPHNKRRDLLLGLGYDYHPALKDGRVNNPLASAGGKKPRLFIKNGHHALGAVSGAEVARLFEEAQNWAVTNAAFGSPR